MDFTNPHFAEPHWLWGAAAFPLAILGLTLYAAWRRRQQLSRFAAARPLVELTASCHAGRRRWKTAFLMAAAALIGVALARPQWGEQVEQLQSWGEDVLFLLDTSRSMLAADVKPTRLGKAKLALSDFARRHTRGRLGLLVFSGDSFLQCPLTGDHDAFRESVMGVDEKAVPVAGTDIGRALEEAVDCLEKDSRRKILVLVTDGEDLEAGAVAMAAKLATNTVVHASVYVIGVGTETGGTIQVFNEQGVVELVKDDKGQPVVTHLDAKNLAAIAQACGGHYFPLGALGEGLAKVRADLKATLNHGDAQLRRKLGVERFHPFVGLLLLLLVVESLMGDRRERPGVAPGVSRAAGLAAALLAMWLGSLAAWAGEPAPASGRVETIQRKLDAIIDQVSGAAGISNDVVNLAPASIAASRSPRLVYNTGVERLRAGKLTEAESLLQRAAASQRRELQVPAFYNLGQARFKLGVEALKQALELGPLSERSRAASVGAIGATYGADMALSGSSLPDLLAAYREGQGARKQLKAAMEAVKQAMDTYGATLVQWERAASDFKTSAELDPRAVDAAFNGQVVDQHIARLIDDITQLMGLMPALGTQRQELKMRLKALKERLPPGMAKGGDEEGDEEDDKPKEPQKGQKEAPNKEGRQRVLSREEAMRWLDALRLDAERKLPTRSNQEGRPGNRNARNW
jgi:Mg-chelatase subunit ChlD